jgi:hypothetical protein
MNQKGKLISAREELRKKYNENITVMPNFVIDAMALRVHCNST